MAFSRSGRDRMISATPASSATSIVLYFVIRRLAFRKRLVRLRIRPRASDTRPPLRRSFRLFCIQFFINAMRSKIMQELSLAALSLIGSHPVDAIRAAGKAGFRSVGLRLAAIPGSGVDNDLLGNATGIRQVRRALDDAGVQLLDAEVFRFSPADGVLTPRQAMLETAAELGARSVGVTSYEPDLDRNADLLAELAGAAAEYRLSCVLEFMGFSGVKTLDDARTVVDRSEAENAYILVDTLHLTRTGATVSDLSALPPRYLTVAQICDVSRTGAESDPVKARAEAISARLDPGAGVLPLVETIRALPADLPLSIEVPRPDGRTPDEHAAALMAAATTVLAAV
ncbi:sugar phosphate isomerase/epimerase family protein [Rhodococcus aetherivorans]|uniref:sugar phosphate isomerase/epimerase family protein n=2 Tax=Nocardiaceae TaxID=85025 RepID=UPI001115454C